MTSNPKANIPDEPTAPTDEPMPEQQFQPPYLGKIAYVEPADSANRYRSGSYLIIDETSGELRGFSLNKGGLYEMAHPESLPLVGAGAFRVLAVDAPSARHVADLDGIIAEAHGALNGASKTHNYNDSIYEHAYTRARDTRHLIAEQLGLPANPDEPTFPAPAKPTVVTTGAGSATETRALLEPLVELLKPLTLAGASAELHVVFPAATSAEQKADADRRAASRRLGEAIIATSLHPDNR